MRKLVVFVMLMTCVISAQAQWKVTPEAGMNVTKYKGDVAKVGFKAGAAVSYTFGSGWFSLQSGLYYVRRGKGLLSYDEIYGTSENRYGGRENTSLFLYPSFSGLNNWSYGNGYYGNGSVSSDIYGIKDFDVEGIRHRSQKEHREYIQLPILARFDWQVSKDVRLHLTVGPYLAVGLGGKVTYEESDYSLKGKLPYNKEISYNPFNPGQGYAVAPRFDWGATIEAGIEVKRVAFKVGYDLGVDKQYKGYAYNIGLNYHTASFTLGYTF
ncbi:outer membrane beta-barrel protein [Parabacteroides sp.]|uniref:outer membrane beta-barrel protein n=1 Tax=Parabacteroides sp. TaxID=1869337 RepID=UPI00257CB6AF|nr:outer membrane beta-barrel protein [Parabacteroides sp.]